MSDVGMWTCRLADDYRTCCTEWFEQRGLVVPQNRRCLNETWWRSVHEADRPRLLHCMEQLNSGAITRLNERYRIRHTNGQWQWVVTRAEATHWNKHDKPTHLAGVDSCVHDTDMDSCLESIGLSNSSGNSILTEHTPSLEDEIKTLTVALENAEQGVWHVDEGRKTCAVNSIWKKMRGRSAASHYDLSNAQWHDDVHPDDLDMVLNRDDIRDEKNTSIINYTYRHRHTDGSWRWIWVRGKIVERDSDGRPLRRMGSDTDITAIKEAEQRSERLSSMLDLAMQAAGMGVWEWQLNAEGSYWDTRACKLFGINGEGRFVPSNQFLRMVHPDDLEALENELRLATDARLPIAVEYRIVHPKGGIRHIKTHADYHDLGDNTLRYVGIVWDVTDDYRRESELANAKKLLDDVIEHMDQGLVLFRGKDLASSQIALTNSRFFKLLELPEHLRVLNSDFNSYVNYLASNGYFSTDGQFTVDLFMQRMRDRKNTAIMLCTPSGRTVRATASVMESDAVILTLTDITDLIRAENEQKELTERLNHSQRLQAIGELTGGIAHDFNNLLAIISGNAELLGIAINESNRHLRAITSAAQSGANLTQSLLAFSSKQALNPSPINMRYLVENVCTMLDRTLGNTVEVQTVMPDDPWTCMADPGQLENALINLAVNARDAMPQGGTLKIQVSNAALNEAFVNSHTDIVAGDYVRITVTDTGAGMSQATLNKAIDPFFTTKQVGDGSGLGLSMVFGFIKQSSGHMEIEGALNRGTTVSLYLPRCYHDTDNDYAAMPSQRRLPQGKGKCIMLIEDDPNVQQMLEWGLTQFGYKVVTASSARQVLVIIDSMADSIDLVVSDVMLPDGVNGFELGKSISADYPHIPIIYMSGFAQRALSEASGETDDIELLQKPFSLDELARRIEINLEPVTG